MAIIKISWTEFQKACSILVEILKNSGSLNQITGIYGVPRGGCYVAMILSQILNLPIADEPGDPSKILIVDDIFDSGKTLSQFPNHLKAVPYTKQTNIQGVVYSFSTSSWLEFPWESSEKPAEDGVVRILQAIGENPSREGLLNTPKRVTKSWKEIYGGYSQDPAEVLKVTFEDDMQDYDQIILCDNIEMYSMCEHHMLPFFGKVHVGYIPNKKVVGLSKLARVVDIFSRRLQIQEKLTQQIANAIQEHLDPIGVGVIIQAKHFCMMSRGVGKQNSMMTTSCLLGEMRESAKDEFLKLCIK